jgi:hypothetical protein
MQQHGAAGADRGEGPTVRAPRDVRVGRAVAGEHGHLLVEFNGGAPWAMGPGSVEPPPTCGTSTTSAVYNRTFASSTRFDAVVDATPGLAFRSNYASTTDGDGGDGGLRGP